MAEHPEKKCVIAMWSEEKEALVSYAVEVNAC